MLWQRVNLYSKWIIIFDNVGSYIDIKYYLPPDPSIKGVIFITTQQSRFLKDNPEANFSINHGLEETDAIQLLTELSGRHEEDKALNLVKKMDYSPLGIRIAGSYIQSVGTTFEYYTHLLQTSRHERLVDQVGGAEFINQVTQDNERTMTLQMALQFSIQRVKKSNPLLFDALQYCGYLANENIPLDLLIELCRTSGQKKNEVEGELKVLIVGKENYSLLSHDSVNGNCYVHRTTQAIIRKSSDSPIKVIQKVVDVILKLYPYDQYSLERLTICRRLESHFLALSQHISSNPEVAKVLIVERLKTLVILGQLEYRFSQYFLASQYLQDAWQVSQESSGDYHQIQIEILRFLAHTNYFLRQFIESRQYMEKAREIGYQIYKSTDWHFAQIYNELGDILRLDTSTRDDALKLFQQAIEICENCQSPSVDSKMQLVYAHRAIGQSLVKSRDLFGAFSSFNKALEICRQCLNNSHQYITGLYKNLGTLGLNTDPERFVNVGIDYSTARGYVEQALLTDIWTYGSQSHEVASSYHWKSRLSYVSQDSKDRETALQDQDQAIQIVIPILGPTSQDLMAYYYWKGRILQKLNREIDAKTVYEEVLKIGQNYPTERVDLIRKSQERLEELKPKVSFVLDFTAKT